MTEILLNKENLLIHMNCKSNSPQVWLDPGTQAIFGGLPPHSNLFFSVSLLGSIILSCFRKLHTCGINIALTVPRLHSDSPKRETLPHSFDQKKKSPSDPTWKAYSPYSQGDRHLDWHLHPGSWNQGRVPQRQSKREKKVCWTNKLCADQYQLPQGSRDFPSEGGKRCSPQEQISQ